MSNKILVVIIIILLAGLGLMIWKVSRPVESPSMLNQQDEQDSTANSQAQPDSSQQNTPATTTPAEVVKPLDITDNGQLQIKTLKAGAGMAAKIGDEVTVHYTGWFLNGTKFDSSLDRGEPFMFTLGEGRVIPGWEQGVLGMKPGEKRQLVVPYTLAYGESDYGPIPGKSTLVFEVELLSVKATQ